MLCEYIVHTTIDIGMGKETVVRPKELVRSAQYFVLSLIKEGLLADFELLNLDMLSNAVVSLKHFNAVYYEVSDRFFRCSLIFARVIQHGALYSVKFPQRPSVMLNDTCALSLVTWNSFAGSFQ